MTVVDRRRPDISLDLPREKPAFAQYLTKSSAVVNSAVVSAIAVINGGHKESSRTGTNLRGEKIALRPFKMRCAIIRGRSCLIKVYKHDRHYIYRRAISIESLAAPA
jgi:hypothetical protein